MFRTLHTLHAAVYQPIEITDMNDHPQVYRSHLLNYLLKYEFYETEAREGAGGVLPFANLCEGQINVL